MDELPRNPAEAKADSSEPLKVAIDQAADLRALRKLQRRGVIELRQANELEQAFRQVIQQKKGFTLGHSRLGGPDVLADEIVHDIERIVGPENRRDVGHLYAAYLNGCDYFVTEDVSAFIRKGRRRRLEALLRLKIRRSQELLTELQRRM